MQVSLKLGEKNKVQKYLKQFQIKQIKTDFLNNILHFLTVVFTIRSVMEQQTTKMQEKDL